MKASTLFLALICLTGVGYLVYERRNLPAKPPAPVSKVAVVAPDAEYGKRIDALTRLVQNMQENNRVLIEKQQQLAATDNATAKEIADLAAKFKDLDDKVGGTAQTVAKLQGEIGTVSDLKAIQNDLPRINELDARIKTVAEELPKVRALAKEDHRNDLQHFSDMVESWHKYFNEQQAALTKKVTELENRMQR